MNINGIIELYQRHGSFTNIEDGYILLRFKEDSKLNLIIKLVQSKHPLSFEKVKNEYVKFFEIGQKYNCYQYRIICTAGFSKEAKELSELNIALSDNEYINSLRNDSHIELYAHNDVTYERIKSHFVQYNKIAVIQPTGTGKSLVIAKLIMENLDKQFLVLTPSRFIIAEIKKHLPKTGHVNFMTYAKAMMLEAKEIKQLNPFYIILDEFHRCGAEEWSRGVDILLKHYPDIKILGTTATPIRYLDDARNMAEEIFENHIAQNLTLAKAIVARILPSPTYVSALYTFDQDYHSLKKKILKSSSQDKKLLLERLNKLKLNWEQSNGVPAIFKKHVSSDIHKIIVFCKNIKHLHKMKPIVLNWFKSIGITEILTYEIHSETESLNRALFKEFEQPKKELDILFSVNMLNEGIHVKGVNCVILMRDTESPVIFFQQIGRCLKIGQNTNPLIIDLVNNFNNIRINDFIRDYTLEKQVFYDRLGGLPYPEVNFNIIDEIKHIQDLYVELSNSIESWEIFIQKLIEFKRIKGHCNVPELYDKSLALKVFNTRKDFVSGKLGLEKIKQLDEIGFQWNVFDKLWNKFIIALTGFKQEHGHCNVHYKYEDKWLVKKISHTRENYKKGKLTDAKIKQLENLGFLWKIENNTWNLFISRLNEFKNKYGHCNVPNVDETKWLIHQIKKNRKEYEIGSLDENKVELLNKLGFVWKPELFKDTIWDKFIKELTLFKDTYKHCNVPFGYKNNWLATKVGSTRKNYKDKTLDKVRIEQLEDLGFIWKVGNDSWNSFIFKLADFKIQQGHYNVPINYSDGWLVKKVILMRNKYKTGNLNKEKIDYLNSLGFEWDNENKMTLSSDSGMTSWDRFIKQLTEFKETYGSCNMPLGIENKSLSKKILHTRENYKKGKLSKERIDQLNSLNFTWSMSNEKDMDIFLDKLLNYKKVYGHCNVPYSFTDQWLAREVRYIRKYYKYGSITPARISELENIGFNWSIEDNSWELFITVLSAFKEKNGHCNVTKGNSDEKLWKKARSVRQLFKNSKLEKERIKQLDDLDFKFKLR